MRLSDPKTLEALPRLGVELKAGASLAELTSLGIGGNTDLLLVRRHDALPELVSLLREARVPYRFLGGGSNLLVPDGELPWLVLQLARQDPEVRFEGNFVYVDAAADLGRTVTFCAKHDLGGMEGLIGVPGTVGGALRMNAGAYGMQIGSYVREVTTFRAADGRIEILKENNLSFEYRHTSFAPDDIMLAVKLELPSKPYREILQGIRICNEKRRASQPLNQKSAGCIFKNPPGKSAGRMIDELGLKGLAVGDARVSDRHANFFVNAGHATCADMLALIADVRERVLRAYGVALEHEVILWTDDTQEGAAKAPEVIANR
jgi:UDP-N-acetylmuramate dehydrogenase